MLEWTHVLCCGWGRICRCNGCRRVSYLVLFHLFIESCMFSCHTSRLYLAAYSPLLARQHTAQPLGRLVCHGLGKRMSDPVKQHILKGNI
jgi:hypothetical protein